MPIRLTSITCRNVASGNGPLRPTTRPGVAIPAQVTTTRSVPSAAAASRAAVTAASSVTSAGREHDPVAQLVRDRLARRGRQVDDHDPEPVGGEPAYRRLTEPGTTTGDQGDVGRAKLHQTLLKRSRLITSRWIWLVPSKIWVTLASRMYRSAGNSRV